MQINTDILNIRITKTQKQTLDKLKGYNVNVSQFIRNAIKEKINRDQTLNLKYSITEIKASGKCLLSTII